MKPLISFSICALLTLCTFQSYAQGRKLPDFSFQFQSTEFADANKRYNERNEYIDTLKDELVLGQLVKILQKNEALRIKIVGHTCIGESDTLGELRAQFIKKRLVSAGLAEDRFEIENVKRDQAVISDQVMLSLPTREEKEAANQRNRRVTIEVIAN